MNRDLAIILQHYGLLGGVSTPQSASCCARNSSARIIFASQKTKLQDLNIEFHDERAYQVYYHPRAKSFIGLWKKHTPVYHALLPHISFTGGRVKPVWVNEAGRAVIAWGKKNNERIFLVGLDVVNEVIRFRQGDPDKAETTSLEDRETWGFAGERPLYLFQNNLLPGYRTIPWADHLCFFLCEVISMVSGYPLLEILPGGAKGAVILTGDDDQAFLDKYEKQLKLIGNFPITYFLHHRTKHTNTTLKNLPGRVDLGFHPDALDRPNEYGILCVEQLAKIHELAGKSVRIIRNHGYLNDGYLGHLKIWEENGLILDTNYPGLDGTALNGSFLPMRVRRPDGSWSNHFSLLTAFGDGILSINRINQKQAIKRVRQLALQIEGSYPGVIVFNFHPQNVSETIDLHRAVMQLGRRPGWIALGLEEYLDWLEMLNTIILTHLGQRTFLLRSPRMVKNLVLRNHLGGKWLRKELDPWSMETEVRFP